jgi:hypothetical protein
VCVLELAKAHNLRLWYGGIRTCFPDARLLVHDTDSFYVAVWRTNCEDVVEKLKALDCVDGSKTKQPGLLKIEAERIVELIALGKKMYSCLLHDGDRKSASVGIKSTPSHDKYRERLMGGPSEVETYVTRWDQFERRVRAEKRDFAGTVDTSRYWLPMEDGASLALGHFASV